MYASKTEFAGIAKVSAGRVSQWIAEGKITLAEMDGAGRNAKINIEAALEKLKLRLDPAQRLGNGLATNLKPPAAPSSIPELQSTTENDTLDVKLKQAKLAEAEARNRKLAEDEKLRQGIYMLANQASAEGAKMVSVVLQMFESGLTETASEIAATYQLPSRDLVHLMRKNLRALRVKIAANLANDALAEPTLIEDAD